nr:hypothetical protein [uncultured Acinetobacter sp.]
MPNNVIVPEVGTKCIYPVLDAQKIKKYCIQQDGNIIETTGQKVSQTKGNTYYLEHSTDTNAINSFYGATIIGICFAILATWLAWWCAKRSFDLTTKSFQLTIAQIQASITASEKQTEITLEQIKDSTLTSEKQTQLTIEQIKASAEASERQTQITIESNTNLITHQEKINLQTIKANSRQSWINTVREFSIEFIYQVDEYVDQIREIHNTYFIHKNGLDKGFLNEMSVLNSYLKNIHKKIIQLTLFLNPFDENDETVIYWAKDVEKFMKISSDIFEENSKFDKMISEIITSKEQFESNIQTILKTEWEKIKKGE